MKLILWFFKFCLWISAISLLFPLKRERALSVVIVIFSCYSYFQLLQLFSVVIVNDVYDICNIFQKQLFTSFLTLFHRHSLKKKNLIFYTVECFMKFIHILSYLKLRLGFTSLDLFNRKRDAFQEGEYLQHLVLYKNDCQQYAENI